MTLTAVTTVIELRPVSPDKYANYGVMFESGTVHKVTGQRVHNRFYPHRIAVWDNTTRHNTEPDRWNEFSGKPGPGRYVDPRGKGTNSPYTILLTAETMVIASEGRNPDASPYGDTLAVGQRIQLLFPNGALSPEFEIKNRVAQDPYLEPVTA